MEHYYTKNQSSELKLRLIKEHIRAVELKLYLCSGVFSAKKIDTGSRLLANRAIVKAAWHVLDLGCGIGVVGIAVAKAHSNTKVLLTDVNERAVYVAKINSKLNNCSNVEIRQSNGFESIDKKFDTILLNPPQTAGKKLCFKLIEQSKQHLKTNGLFQLVARHNKGGKSLNKFMQEVFGNSEVLAKQSGYRIYVSKLIGDSKNE